MRTWRLTATSIVICSILTAGFGLAVGAPTASAAKHFRQLLKSNPIAREGFVSSMAVDSSSERVYMGVVNRLSGERNAVEVLNDEGQKVAQITRSFGTAFNNSLSVAVDNAAGSPSKGDVYVGDHETGLLYKFRPVGSSEYEFVCEITGRGSGCHENPEPAMEAFGTEGINSITVDVQGNVYVGNGIHGFIDEFNSTGEDVVQLPAQPTGSLAVDTHGNVYVQGKGGVEKLERGGFTGPVEHEVPLPILKSQGLAVDPVTGNVDVIGLEVIKEEIVEEIEEYNQAGELQLSFGVKRINSFAVDGVTDDVYVYNGVTLDVFGPPVGLPSVVSDETTSASAQGVAVSGTVNPNGTPVTGCAFEYATFAFFEAHPSSYEGSVQCTPSAGSLGSGESAIPVGATLPLPPNTLYHWRLIASNTNGHAENLVDRTFASFRPPAVIGARITSNLTQFKATLNATLNPEGLPTSYHFAYGTSTAYGSSVPIPDEPLGATDNSEHAVAQEITGLQAGTTYHYALVATSTGGVVTGPDQTFTTPGIPAPAVSTGGVEGITVGAATLTGSIDGQGWETTYHFEYGPSASYGSDWPTVDVPLGALTGAQGVQSRVLNLLPGTLYHYRLVATNGGGVGYGPDQTFTTGEYPLSVIQENPLVKTPLGIGPSKKTSTKALTNAQKLSNALRACARKPKGRRAACRRQAHKRYAPAARKRK